MQAMIMAPESKRNKQKKHFYYTIDKPCHFTHTEALQITRKSAEAHLPIIILNIIYYFAGKLFHKTSNRTQCANVCKIRIQAYISQKISILLFAQLLLQNTIFVFITDK